MYSKLVRTSILFLAVAVISGCTSAATSNTARTAREQLLISNAVDQSLAKVNFASLAGSRVFLEEKYMDSVDKPYIVGTLRHHVLRSGASLVGKAEDADVIMEARSGGVGTDMSEKFVGINEITLPGLLSIPEIRIAENKAQQGYAKIGLVVLDAKTNQMLGEGGVSMARSEDSNWYVMGVGPFQNGTIRSEIDYASRSTMGMQQRALTNGNVAFSSPSPASLKARPKLRLVSGEEAK